MRRQSIRALLAVFALAVTGCSTTGGGKDTPDVEATETLEAMVPLPQAVNKLTMQSRHVYAQEAAGVQYRYAGDLVYFVDVFVYPLKEHQKEFLFKGDETGLVTDEFGQFRAELDYSTQQGWYQSVEPVEELLSTWRLEFELDGAQREVPFVVGKGEYRIRKDGNTLASFVALSEFNGYFVKIRLSHPDYPGLRAEMQRFSEILFRELYDSQTQLAGISVGKDDAKTTVTCLPGESMLECLSRAMRSVTEMNAESTPGDST